MKEHVSPWGLTESEADAMDTMAATGQRAVAARRLGIQAQTLNHVLKIVRGKMNEHSTMRAVVVWDRWRRPKGEGRCSVSNSDSVPV